MKNRTLGIVILIGFGLCQLWLFSGCEVNRGGVVIGSPAPPPSKKPGPPPWAPAHGRRAKYRYYYYPSHYVYYDTARGVYFYLAGDGWRVSAHLPSGVQLEYADYVARSNWKQTSPMTVFQNTRRSILQDRQRKRNIRRSGHFFIKTKTVGIMELLSHRSLESDSAALDCLA